jgi:flagellar basal body P-ring formation protein FlgA
MKQVANSLLTLSSTPFNAISDAPVFPRDMAGAINRNLTPFYIHRENMLRGYSVLLGLSCPPRSLVCSRLGEGRIRNLLCAYSCILLVIWMMVPNARIAIGSEAVVIQLKEEAAIQSSGILLTDVAELQGSDQNLIDSLKRIPLGDAPEFGSVHVLTRHQIGELIRAAVGQNPVISITGAAAVQIRLRGKSIEESEIAPLVKAHIANTTSWKESEIQVRSIGNLKGIEMPQGAQLRLSPNASAPHRSLLFPIEIFIEGKTLRCIWITAEVGVRAGILTAARNIPAGKAISSEDVLQKTVEITDPYAGYVRNLNDVLQKVSRRNFAPGTPLIREAFTNPFLVKSGDTVQLRLVRNGVSLTSLARAEQNGRLGQVIRVRNLEFSAVLKATVTGRAEVRLLQQ